MRYCATRLVKERHVEDALALVERHLPESSDNPARLFARAKLLSDIRAHEQSDALFRRLISQHTDRNMRVEFAKRLRKRGCWRMRSTSSRPSRGTWRPAARRPSWPTRWQATTPSISAWSPNRRWSAGHPDRVDEARDPALPRPAPARTGAGKPVSVALVTGSLGPGGAERQLTRLAGELTRLAEQPGQASLDLLPKPEKVEVLVKQHTEPSGSARS